MNIVKTVAGYGIAGALASFVIFVALYFSGIPPFGNWSWLMVVIPPIIIPLGAQKVRQMEGGYITYWGALKACLMVVLLYSLAYSMMTFLFVVLIDTDGFVVKSQVDAAYEGIDAMRGFFSEEQIDEMIDSVEEISIGKLVSGDFLTKLVSWGLISLIIAAFIRRKDESFESEFKDA